MIPSKSAKTARSFDASKKIEMFSLLRAKTAG